MKIRRRPTHRRIFVCYRHDDTTGHAGRLFDDLKKEFGADSVFRDVDTIKPGRDFVEAVNEALSMCESLLVVIGTSWLTERDKTGNVRLQNPQDFVRQEIENGLARRLIIIPVLVDGARMPAEDDLPATLRPLAHRQAIELTEHHWNDDVNELVAELKHVPPKASPATTSASDAGRSPERMRKQLALASLAAVAVLTAFLLLTSRSRPKLISTGPGKTTTTKSGTTTTTSTTTTTLPTTTVGTSGPANGGGLQATTTRCTNAHLGYSVVVPSGWNANQDSSLLWACTAFGPAPFHLASISPYQFNAAVLFGSLADQPATLAKDVPTNGRNVAIEGQQGLIVEYGAPGDMVYAYVISLGRRSLVAALIQGPSESTAQFRRQEPTLDHMMASLRLVPVTCHDSRDPRCGEFYWTADPDDQPLTGVLTVSSTDPDVDAPVMFTITMNDPDADIITETSQCFGDPPCGGFPVTSPLIDCPLSFACRLTPATESQPSGGFNPPPKLPGTRTFSFTHAYANAGTYTFTFQASSSNSMVPPDVVDPYADSDSLAVTINVQ